jgi:hypothetical protein
LKDILAFVMLMALFIVATTPELVGEWEARKNLARDQYTIATEK